MTLPTEWLSRGLDRRASPPFGEGRPTPPADSRVRTERRRSLLHLSRAAPGSPKVGSRMVQGEESGGAERAAIPSAALRFGRPCDHAATSSSSSSSMTCPRYSSSQEWWTFLLCCSYVCPQCKRCSRPSNFSRCRSWTRLWTRPFVCVSSTWWPMSLLGRFSEVPDHAATSWGLANSRGASDSIHRAV